VYRNTYFRWITVNDTNISLSFVPCNMNLFLIDTQKFVGYNIQLQKYQLQKFHNVSEEFLRDALACAVYRKFHIGA